LNSKQQLLPSELDIEFKNMDFFWHQGQIAFKDAQKSAKKIFTLLKWNYGTLYSNKYVLQKMVTRLSYLNWMSYWKLKFLLRDDFK
jgi:hypothetical protein